MTGDSISAISGEHLLALPLFVQPKMKQSAKLSTRIDACNSITDQTRVMLDYTLTSEVDA